MATHTHKILNNLEITSLVFVILSLVAILFYPTLFNKTYTLDLSKNFPTELIGDASSNGNSTATRLKSKDSYKWSCMIRKGYDFPYCSFKFDLTDPESGYGLNLSDYEKVTINYLFKGNKKDNIRFYLRTNHEGLTERHEKHSYAYQEIEINPVKDPSPLTFLMTDFKVSHWWLLKNDLPINRSRLNFEEVMFLEILTGTYANIGKKEFEIKSITFSGKIISKENFYLLIIIIWFILLFLLVGYRMILLRSEYKHSQSEIIYFKGIANYDQLSQLLNRHAIDKLFVQVERDWNEHNINYSLIMLDIDHFKYVNDNYGHAVGDQVIINIAKILRTYSRKQDYVGRWGGEEFLILLPSTGLKAATICAEKIRMLIETYKWSDNISITASFGVSTAQDKLTINQVLTEADNALYRSKEDGRNRVTTVEEL